MTFLEKYFLNDIGYRFVAVVLACLLSTSCYKTAIMPENNHYVAAQNDNANAAQYNIQLGLAYLKQGNMSRAKSKLLLAQQQDVKLPEVWDALGIYYYDVSDEQSANQCYQRAVTLAPKRGDILNDYGVFLCASHNYQKSISYFQKAVADKNYINVGFAYQNAGLCAEQMGALVESETFFQQALRHNPKLNDALLELANINVKKQNYNLANTYLQSYYLHGQLNQESLLIERKLKSVGIGA